MEQSILKSTKKILGVSPDDDSFDLDIITHINSEFSILRQMGVGPEAGFFLEDDEAQWSELLSDLNDDEGQLNLIKMCVHLRTRLLFDPPTSSYLLDAVKQLLQESEWRLNTSRESTEWVEPDQSAYVIVDGGDPAGP